MNSCRVSELHSSRGTASHPRLSSNHHRNRNRGVHTEVQRRAWIRHTRKIAIHRTNQVTRLTFAITGTLVQDGDRATHKAVGLHSSITASLISPFVKLMGTFGPAAMCEALRVSLSNATCSGAHGSSWQQGGTFIFSHPGLSQDPSVPIICQKAWREQYPGDWEPISPILWEEFGIDADCVNFPERLQFVLSARQRLDEGNELTVKKDIHTQGRSQMRCREVALTDCRQCCASK